MPGLAVGEDVEAGAASDPAAACRPSKPRSSLGGEHLERPVAGIDRATFLANEVIPGIIEIAIETSLAWPGGRQPCGLPADDMCCLGAFGPVPGWLY